MSQIENSALNEIINVEELEEKLAPMSGSVATDV